jgi:flagellar FliL protein
MSDDQDQSGADSGNAGAPKKKLPIAVVIGVGLAAGAAVAVFAIGPKFASASPAAKAAADSAAHAKPAESELTPPSMHILENLVLNPAGSGGSRFLLTSVGLQLKDGTVLEAVKAREPQVRDLVLHVLGTKTVDDLVAMDNRDGFKKELQIAIDSLLGRGSVKAIYFPQFVIQ